MLEAFVFSDFKPKIEIVCFEIVDKNKKFIKILEKLEKIEKEKEQNFRNLIDIMQLEMLR
jgi:hypothetical protein